MDNAHLVTINLGVKSTLAERFEVTLAEAHCIRLMGLACAAVAGRLLDAEREQLVLGAEIFGGSAQSMFGRYRHNDRVTIGYKRSLGRALEPTPDGGDEGGPCRAAHSLTQVYSLLSVTSRPCGWRTRSRVSAMISAALLGGCDGASLRR